MLCDSGEVYVRSSLGRGESCWRIYVGKMQATEVYWRAQEEGKIAVLLGRSIGLEVQREKWELEWSRQKELVYIMVEIPANPRP